LPPLMQESERDCPGAIPFKDLLKRPSPSFPAADFSMDEEELVLYTGGTTGLPKGAVHTHMNLLRCATFGYQIRDLGRDLSPCDSVLVFGPLGHIGAMSYGLLPSAVHGRTMVILARFDPKTALEAIKRYRIELFVGTVPVAKSLLAQPEFRACDFSSVKMWLTGEWMVWLTSDFASQWRELTGNPLVKWGYGMTEIANVCINATRMGYEVPYKNQFMAGCVPPDSDFGLRIVDFETHEELPFGHKGEIVIKSPGRCTYYWNKPKETAESLSPEGWFYSGDIGMLDEQGYLYWFGRKKYLIRVSGFQVSGGEIEMVGRQCPDIENIGVIGVSHPKKGQIPKAFIQLKAGSTADTGQIARWFKENIAAYKVPEVVIMDELPMTPKGSIDMKKLS
ncbi:MAG: AMP-binding protein, partial [Desulfatirhabdiaceae bacterium]